MLAGSAFGAADMGQLPVAAGATGACVVFASLMKFVYDVKQDSNRRFELAVSREAELRQELAEIRLVENKSLKEELEKMKLEYSRLWASSTKKDQLIEAQAEDLKRQRIQLIDMDNRMREMSNMLQRKTDKVEVRKIADQEIESRIEDKDDTDH